jgi:adenylate cyclase
LVTLALWFSGGFDAWEALSYDWRAEALAAPDDASNRIVLIEVDQASLDWAEEVNAIGWPWPRQLYAAIADFCKRGDAASVSFDILFTESSFYGSEDDAELGRALAGHPGSVAVALLGDGVEKPDLPRRLTDARRWLTDPTPEAWRAMTYSSATLPVPEVLEKTKWLANVRLSPDQDGVYRRISPLSFLGGRPVASLGLAALLAADNTVRVTLTREGMLVGEHSAPLDSNGEALLRYRGPAGTHTTFSAAAVLQSELRAQSGEPPSPIDPEELRGKIVLIGFTAPGLMDIRSTPVDGVFPGVEIHATLADNLLTGDFIRSAPTLVTVVWLLALAFVCALLIIHSDSLPPIAIVCAFFSVLPGIAAAVAYHYGWWLPFVAPQCSTRLAVCAALGGRYALEGRQKRFIKGAFSQYLSPVVIDQLIRNPERLKLGGVRRVISIFFSDLAGFTSISEKLEPEELTSFLNHYLTAMTAIIHSEGGTIDKYEGDAIIAFWNAPLKVEDHALRAVRAALKCQEKLLAMQPELKRWTQSDVTMRIGINTGAAVVGNMGSNTRFDYTMLGDAVNLAARLEGANKQFGTHTMIAENTRRELGDAVHLRKLARLTVVGRDEPVEVYEPLTTASAKEHRKTLDVFSLGLQLFEAGDFLSARMEFEKISASDKPAEKYALRCKELSIDPPENWQGVWRLTEKG